MKEIIQPEKNIDVTECEHCYIVSNMPHCAIKLEYTNHQCKQYQNCYYKQLQRIKQENAEWKKENEEINSRMAEVTYRATGGRLSYSNYTLNAIEQAFYDQLEILSDQKAEELEQEIEELKKDNAELKERLESYNCNANCYKYKEANKYKQALEDIKSLLEKSIDIKTNSYWHFHYIEKAQDKINEVLDNENNSK